MRKNHYSALYFASIVSIGGFLFGFDASVISGVIGFIVPQFDLNDWQLGLVVGAPTLGGIIASMSGAWLADVIGRKKVCWYPSVNSMAIVGFFNAMTSFMIQFVFPWELSNLGSASIFFIYSGFGLVALALLAWLLPETKGKSLEELELILSRSSKQS